MRIPVEYVAVIYTTKLHKSRLLIPGRYIIALQVNDIETSIGTKCWGFKRAKEIATALQANAEEVIEDSVYHKDVWNKVQAAYVAKLNAALSEKLQPGDRVKLAVDIGHIKAGRICKVIKAHTKEDGTDGIVDARWPISVEVLPVSGDPAAWAHGTPILLLERGEFVSLDTEL